jgi:hypothetical protein
MNKPQKAVVAQVCIGQIEIEGLMLPDGSYGVAVPQIAQLLQFDSNQASRQFKSLLGKDFQFDKTKSELHPKAVNYVKLKQFTKIIHKMAVNGNKQAQDFAEIMFEFSLQQLFSDAFGVKFEQEDRQNWLKARQEGKVTRRELTDAIKDYLDNHEVSDNYRKFVYNNITDLINLAIFGRRACKLRQDWECGNPREKMTDKEIFLVKEVENLIMRLIDNRGFEPMDATREAIHRLCLPSIKR